MLWGLSTGILVLLVTLPIYHLVVASFKTPGGLSLSNYTQILYVRRFQEAILNTVVLGLVCASFGTLIGALLAWLVSRTNVPLRGFIRVCVMGTFVVPAFVNALSWVLLAGPNAGLLNRLWMFMTRSGKGFMNIYSMEGLAIVSVATVYPLAFIFMYNAFEMMDSEMEEAARVLGASGARTLLTITLPLARPALIAGFILMFLETIILYGAPAVIGIPANIYVITTALWTLFEYPPEIGLAAALSLPLLLITATLLWLQQQLIAQRSFATVQGKGGRWQRTDLGRWKWVAASVACLVIVVTFILPNAVLIAASVLKQAYRGISLPNLGLNHYQYVLFEYTAGIPSVRNSVVTSTAAATFAVIIATVVAFIAERNIARFGSVLVFLAMAPLVIPAMVFAVGLVAAYSTGPLPLYGTLWILVLAYLTKNLPLAFMNCKASLSTVHVELESAARILGASPLRVLKDITGPLIKNGLLAGWILVFAHSLKDLGASVLLYTSKTTVISTAIMDVFYSQNWGAVAAMSVILLGINAAVVMVGYRILGGNILTGGRGV
ncbi:MAG: hypothetical protein A3H39_13805 [candidate division NC10 bacterium RIFCSPLOWO2_02_FULL_66_22]|nr:MAG: hypothetical protein A3H39_13805 [candidate division NC10 bacterium RIFCSPLOWO2_02_FULL_66_22]